MTGKSKESATPKTRTRSSTVTYPYHPIGLCLDLAKAVAEIGNGKQEVSRSLLASHMKVDEQSGDFTLKITSAKTYGLVEGRGGLSLTECAKHIFFPTEDPDRERRVGILEAVRTPSAFAALIDRYDGSKVPGTELIGNVLSQQMGLPESWKTRVTNFFLRSMEAAGAVSSDGYLRYKAETEKIRGTTPTASPRLDDIPPPPPALPLRTGQQPSEPAITEGVETWIYRVNGVPHRIEYPENMTRDVWEKLNRFLKALEPDA